VLRHEARHRHLRDKAKQPVDPANAGFERRHDGLEFDRRSGATARHLVGKHDAEIVGVIPDVIGRRLERRLPGVGVRAVA
jgi:hypothetical protein